MNTNNTNVIQIDSQHSNHDADLINKLKNLTPIGYDRVRTIFAKEMGIRPATLDLIIKSEKAVVQEKGKSPFADIEPWPEPINPEELLASIASTIKRFIVCQPETIIAATLWAAMTWFIDVIQVAPLAVITAPEKRCGKSQLLFLLSEIVKRPLTASNISPAALFRSIDAWQPTLLIDEVDTFMKENNELRGLINAGHTRTAAFIYRTTGEDHALTAFNLWGAKALAGIGKLNDTIMDRSIILSLRRKLPTEQSQRLRNAESGLLQTLAAKLARFALDYSDQVLTARPELPDALGDRAQDNWEPLLAIADIAQGEWPHIARDTSIKVMKRLINDGYVLHQQLFKHQHGIYHLTKKGAAHTSLPPVLQISLGGYQHQLLITDIRQRLCAKHSNTKWVSERYLKHQKFYYGIGKAGHIADGILIFPDGTKVAIEVELSMKGKRRIEKILSAYGGQLEIAEAWYSVLSN